MSLRAWLRTAAPRVLIAGVAAVAAPRTALGCDPAVGPRVIVYLFDYGGAESAEARDKHSQFQKVMHQKARTWGQELGRLGVQAAYLEDLKVKLAGRDEPDDFRQFWSVTQALELMSGIVDGAAGQYTVTSELFIGDLRGTLDSDSLIVGMPITPSQFGNIVDSHSIVTFYALALDAERRRCDPAVSVALLSALEEKIADLRRRGGPLDPGVDRIGRAARAKLDELLRPR